MPLSSEHPAYAERLPDWKLMRDTYQGERKIKDEGEVYLKPTAGQELDGMAAGQKGRKRYDAYRERATFYDVVETAVSALVGIMNIKPANITLPPALEPMVDNATAEGEPLQTLLRRIHTEQLTTARIGLMLELPTGAPASACPFIVPYYAEKVLNWDNGPVELGKRKLEVVVLDETEFVRMPALNWEVKRKYRLLTCVPMEGETDTTATRTFRTALMDGIDRMPTTEELIAPSLAGLTLDFIPFMFVGSKDFVPEPDKPPLLALANLSVSIYRQDADLKNALHEQGQDTLVIIGVDAPGVNDPETRTGGGSIIYVPVGGDAKYVGIGASGLPTMQTAIDADKADAAKMGGQLLDTQGRSSESGDALAIRVAAKTATLMNIAITASAALERLLKMAAVWKGLNPDDVQVQPNLDFAGNQMVAADTVQLMTAKSLGLPLSIQSIHKVLVDRGMTELSFDDEMTQIEDEANQGIGLPPAPPDDGTGGAPDGTGGEAPDPEAAAAAAAAAIEAKDSSAKP